MSQLQDEQIRERIDHVDRFHLTIDPDRQGFMRELVDNVQPPIFLPLVGPVLDEVVGPGVVARLGAKAHARAVVEKQGSLHVDRKDRRGKDSLPRRRGDGYCNWPTKYPRDRVTRGRIAYLTAENPNDGSVL